jgi:predicted Zn-dependent peptidase
MARTRAWIGIVAAALTVALPAGATAQERINERVYLVRDKPGTPTQFNMIVHAGCADESEGRCRGLAHYLEHLVLTGRNPEHADRAARLFPDAASNGHTSTRATVYVHSVPARADGPKADLEKLFTFYAARLRDFAISDEEAARERNVVLQEHDWRVGSNPFRRFERRLDRELLPNHPMGLWTIGTRESIEALTVAEAKTFHRDWYAINNVYFAVKADIEPKEMRDLVERALSRLSARTLPKRPSARQPAIAVGRQDFRETDAQVKNASVFYKKLIRMEEGDTTPQRAARTLYLSYLRSRLPGSAYQALVDTTNLAAGDPQISIDRVAPRTYRFRITAATAPDAASEALLAGIGTYVEGLAKTPPGPEVLDRLKKRFADARANDDRDPARIYSRLVGWLTSRNAYDELGRWPAQIAAVSPGDIDHLAEELSSPGKIVTGVLLPTAPESGK